METWAHSQEIYDLLGRECEHTDRIKNIADLARSMLHSTLTRTPGSESPGARPSAFARSRLAGAACARREAIASLALDFRKLISRIEE